MGDLALVLHQTQYGLRGISRNPRVVVLTLAFPIFFLVLFNSVFASGDESTAFEGGQISTDAYFTAGIIAYSIMMSAFTTLAISLTNQRESGQLKRYRGTPMPPWTFMAAQILRSVLLAVVMVVVLLAIGRIAFDVDIPAERLVGLVVYVVLGTATMCALGIALTTLAPTADAASTIAPFGTVILSFVSGVFVPVDELPSWLEEVGKVFPLAHLAEGLQTSLVTGAGGTGLAADNVAVLAVWALAGLAIAARGFKWEPQAARG